MIPDTSALRHDLEWLVLIAKLRERKQLLVQDFNSRFDGNVIYVGKVSRDELDALVGATMEMYLSLLSGEQLSGELQQLPADLGRRRARQAVPVELLLEGVRTNSRVFWNALRQVAGTDSAQCLVRNTDAVLSLVEWHTREVQRSYLREHDELQRSNERRRQRSIARIFDDERPDRKELEALAFDLGVPCDGLFDVVVQLGVHDGNCGLCRSYLKSIFVHELASGTCHFRLASDDELFEPLKGVRSAVLRGIRGVDRLHAASRGGLSIVVARSGFPPEPVSSDNAWASVAWRAMTESLGPDLLPLNLGSLRALNPEARQRLVETVEVFLETGSIKDTANRLFCHRNTIVKRLATFEELIGIDLAVPARAALAVLALSAPLDD
ncbi:helix-turn-helix domain-containing protein [Paenarthrobacter nicotinovorans]|uniref:PucR family transcriptional regulator n=1 Tax=Paenarthrobacter nicotinovorans TaxID=29320 RepID=UPI00380ABB1C